MYVVEVKKKWYSLTEIQNKIKTCVEKMFDESNLIKTRTVVIPLLYAERHISNARRTFNRYSIKVRGKPKSIDYLKNGQNIVKALKI